MEQKSVETAAHTAAMRTYTALKRFDLVKGFCQLAAEEGEHRVLANAALGTRPANDVAVEPALYSQVSQLLTFLKQRGYVGGSGAAFNFRGPGTIDATGVTERTPGGPAMGCLPAATPGAATAPATGSPAA